MNKKRIIKEFENAYETLHNIKKAVTMFGSARTIETNKEYYKKAAILSHKLFLNGYSIISGGGLGTMEAFNMGAYSTTSKKSIGFTIEISNEVKNTYITLPFHFNYFFLRKLFLVAYSEAFIFFPGGFGTLDEMFEVLTLMQTQKTKKAPIILFGKEYWNKLLDFIKNTQLQREYISQKDFNLITVEDDIEKIISIIDKGESYEKK